MHLVFRVQAADISIHALREEGDAWAGCTLQPSAYFYPRPPRGGRRDQRPCGQLWRYFYPRPPRGGRPWTAQKSANFFVISIHALREEGDSSPGTLQRHFDNFYPRPPRGGRRNRLLHYQEMLEFLSTPSARRATHRFCIGAVEHKVFLSTPSARRATQRLPGGQQRLPISIHALREEGDRITG